MFGADQTCLFRTVFTLGFNASEKYEHFPSYSSPLFTVGLSNRTVAMNHNLVK